MDAYEFQSKWNPATTPPAPGTRCIVTDGEVVVFGTYVKDLHCNLDENVGVWIVTEVKSDHPFVVAGWMSSPKPMKLSVPYDDTNLAKM